MQREEEVDKRIKEDIKNRRIKVKNRKIENEL